MLAQTNIISTCKIFTLSGNLSIACILSRPPTAIHKKNIFYTYIYKSEFEINQVRAFLFQPFTVRYHAVGVSNNITGVSNDITKVSNDITGVSNDITGVSNDITGVSNGITGVSSSITGDSSEVVGATPLLAKHHHYQLIN